MKFVKNNNNPSGKKRGDCVVRALAHATDNSWQNVYISLTNIGFQQFCMPAEKISYERFLEVRNWEKHKMPKHANGKRYTVRQLIDENPDMEAVITIAGHMTYCQDGTLYDLWDCSNKSVCNYWTKKPINN